jgi:hypothetical protein
VVVDVAADVVVDGAVDVVVDGVNAADMSAPPTCQRRRRRQRQR